MIFERLVLNMLKLILKKLIKKNKIGLIITLLTAELSATFYCLRQRVWKKKTVGELVLELVINSDSVGSINSTVSNASIVIPLSTVNYASSNQVKINKNKNWQNKHQLFKLSRRQQKIEQNLVFNKVFVRSTLSLLDQF